MLRKISFILSILLLLAASSISVFSAFSNPGFENPPPANSNPAVRFIPDVNSSGWKTTHPTSGLCTNFPQCRPIEFWSNGFGVAPPQGNQFIELQAETLSMVYQQISLTNGDTLNWSFFHRGRVSPTVHDVAEFRIGIPGGLPGGVPADSYGLVIARVSTTNSGAFLTPTGAGTITATPAGNGWVRYSGTYVYNVTGAPQTVNIGFRAVSSYGGQGGGNLIDAANLEIKRQDACCDQMKVKPFWTPDVSMQYLTFEIYNVKYPPSPVCSIDINILNSSGQQPPSGWQGGGLFVNGVPKSVPIWWKLPYNKIPNNGVTVINGQPNFNSPAVQFNLGVDYSTPYTGTVYLTINHCDGSVCKLELKDWTPKPPPRIRISVDEAYPIGFEQALVAVITRFQPLRGTKGSVKWIVVEALDEDAEIFSVDADSSKNRGEDKNTLTIVSADKRGKIALYELAQPVNLGSAVNGELNLVLKRKEKASGKPVLKYIFFDENANPIGFTTNEEGK